MYRLSFNIQLLPFMWSDCFTKLLQCLNQHHQEQKKHRKTANPESIEDQQVQKISLHFFQTGYLSSHGIKAFPSSRCCDMLLPSPSPLLSFSVFILCAQQPQKKGAKYFPENRPPFYSFFLKSNSHHIMAISI